MSNRWIFLPLPSGKPWSGNTIYTEALGGSESAAFYTALSLAKLGEDVSMCTHGTKMIQRFEGVQYYPIDDPTIGSLLQQHWDVVVSSRWFDILNQPWQTEKRVLWLHDMPSDVPPLTYPLSKVVFISDFQFNAWHVQGMDTTIIGNGVDLKLFDQMRSVPRNEKKVIWTSNPDRGLALAAKIFQEVRKRWPDLEFHVYGRASVYGWSPEQEAPFLPRDEHMENVFLHDPLPKYALARELCSSWAFFYPTYWPETYCIAALEAQAAGTPIISVPFGALSETVKGGILSYDLLNAFSQLRNTRRWNKLNEAGLEFAKENTWEKQAQRWIDNVAHTQQ